MGRFLKDFGKLDKTRAGKIMIASGKAVSYSSQQRLALRPSIIRLAEEVDTFYFRAIDDTSQTVSGMEKVRTEYRLFLIRSTHHFLNYRTRAIITRGLYIFTHFLKTISLFSRTFIGKILYG